MELGDRVFSEQERQKIPQEERYIISRYEQITGNQFKRKEYIFLKKTLELVTAEQAIASIAWLHKKSKERFTYYAYAIPIFKNGVTGSRKTMKKKKLEE